MPTVWWSNPHFDGERARTEHDFRIFIRPSAWAVLREFCLQHITLDNDHIIETDPTRELVEEFADTLAINLKPDQYVCKPVTTAVENNIHARGVPTVRIYRIFEASIIDLSLTQVMLISGGLSHRELYERSSADAQNGGRGRAMPFRLCRGAASLMRTGPCQLWRAISLLRLSRIT